MSPHEQKVIDLSLAVLRDAQQLAKHATVQTPAVRLALRCLLPYVAQKWPLESFWDGAGGDNQIGRSQTLNAAYNGTILQLQAKGRVATTARETDSGGTVVTEGS